MTVGNIDLGDPVAGIDTASAASTDRELIDRLGRDFRFEFFTPRLINICKTRKLDARCFSKCRQISVLRHTTATHKPDSDQVIVL